MFPSAQLHYNAKKNKKNSRVFFKAAMLGMKLQRQKELDLEEVREDVTPWHILHYIYIFIKPVVNVLF